jgi:hypothetical protein
MQPVIGEPRASTFPRWVHRTLRKRAVRDGRPTTIERVPRRVEDVDLSTFDLIVALHPDEATEPTPRAAVAYGVDFAIVPCCVFPLDCIKRSRDEWLTYLAALAPGARMKIYRLRAQTSSCGTSASTRRQNSGMHTHSERQ